MRFFNLGLLFSILMFIGCGSGSQVEIDFNQIQERNDLVYAVNEEKPFTGKVIYSNKNNVLTLSKEYKNGVLHGESIYFYENGHKERLGEFRNGTYLSGAVYFDNGQIYQETKLLGEKNEIQSFKQWHDNGHLNMEGKRNALSGEKVGEWNYYDENGNPTEAEE